MNTIEQARDVSSKLKVKSSSLEKQAADTIDALIAEFEKVTVERDHVNDVCDSYVAELASIKQQEPVGVVVRVDSAMAPGCSYLQGTMIKNTPDGALLYLAAGAHEQRKPLSDEQITEVWRELREQKEDWSDLDFARAIEAYIKEQP